MAVKIWANIIGSGNGLLPDGTNPHTSMIIIISWVQWKSPESNVRSETSAINY